MMSISLCHVVQIAPSSRKLTISTKRLEYRESFKSKKITKVNSSLLMHPDLPEYQVRMTIFKKKNMLEKRRNSNSL